MFLIPTTLTCLFCLPGTQAKGLVGILSCYRVNPVSSAELKIEMMKEEATPVEQSFPGPMLEHRTGPGAGGGQPNSHYRSEPIV